MSGQASAAEVPRQPDGDDASTPGHDRHRIGAGRSGEVWLVRRPDGPRAIKVFFGDTLTNVVHYLFTGAPNAYIWNEDAIHCAFERRRILQALAVVWFGDRLTVSNAVATGWNTDALAWELATEYIEGRPVPLLHPLRPRNPSLDELRQLTRDLQGHLEAAGFDGAVWQAGRGNPVALNNFLCLGQGDPVRFGFIDLESGVPALFPMQPLELFRFYLPRSWRHGRALFDDVDVPVLTRYLDTHRMTIASRLGASAWRELRERADRLGWHQERWRSLARAQAAIAYQRVKGRLSIADARYYERHRLRWWLRESRRLVRKALALAGAAALAAGRRLRRIDVAALFRNLGRFVSSQEYRSAIARDYVAGRVGAWKDRHQLSETDAQQLLDELGDDESSNYLTDFGAHLGMKATFQALEFTLLAALAAAGVISLLLLAIIVALDGLIYRSAYTLYRTAQAAARRRPRPWVALVVGFVPLLGSLAYPMQMVYAARTRRACLARFVIYDTFTTIGTRLPIWGGKDTLVEHWFNRLAHRVLSRSAPGVPVVDT